MQKFQLFYALCPKNIKNNRRVAMVHMTRQSEPAFSVYVIFLNIQILHVETMFEYKGD